MLACLYNKSVRVLFWFYSQCLTLLCHISASLLQEVSQGHFCVTCQPLSHELDEEWLSVILVLLSHFWITCWPLFTRKVAQGVILALILHFYVTYQPLFTRRVAQGKLLFLWFIQTVYQGELFCFYSHSSVYFLFSDYLSQKSGREWEMRSWAQKVESQDASLSMRPGSLEGTKHMKVLSPWHRQPWNNQERMKFKYTPVLEVKELLWKSTNCY